MKKPFSFSFQKKTDLFLKKNKQDKNLVFFSKKKSEFEGAFVSNLDSPFVSKKISFFLCSENEKISKIKAMSFQRNLK